jgi:uncharacterized protein YndB with AHSA1/START domain
MPSRRHGTAANVRRGRSAGRKDASLAATPVDDEEDGMTGHVATAEIDIDAPQERVWSALTDPDEVEKYMFGSRVESDWQPGSPIVWKGEWQGKPFEDKGTVVEVDPGRTLVVTHFSPLSGQEDRPENYHTLTYRLEPDGQSTHVTLSQDNNSSEDEASHSQENWQTMLTAMKTSVEGS